VPLWTQTAGVAFTTRPIDNGVVYASKDFHDPLRGRRLMWGNVGDGASNAMTLPREVTWNGELGYKLEFAPLPEQEKLRTGLLRALNTTQLAPHAPVLLGGWKGGCSQIEVSIELGWSEHPTNVTLTLHEGGRSNASAAAVNFTLVCRPPTVGELPTPTSSSLSPDARATTFKPTLVPSLGRRVDRHVSRQLPS
jgi:sucrose-6-phosphate hydrolase SacC (GH32 family)